MPIDRFTNRRQCSAKQVSVFLLESVVVGCKGRCLHGSNRRAAGTCAGLGQGLLVQVGSLCAPGQVGLHLPELGQVERGDLLGLLDLLLVRLDLALELVNETLHPLVVLPVLVLLVSQLLDVSLGPTEGLLGVSAPPVLRIHLGLKLANSGFHLGHRLLASLQCILLSFVASVLGVLHLGFQKLLVPLQGHGSLLLHAQLICKASSINHGALSFLLGKMSLSSHLVQVMAHGSHLLLALHLGPTDRLVGASLVAQALVCVCKLLDPISCSYFILAPQIAWLVQVWSLRLSFVSASSCSTMRRLRSACSSRVLASSRAFWFAFARRSAEIRLSVATALARLSSSNLFWTFLMLPWIRLMLRWLSALAALACSRATPRSMTSESSFFFMRRASTLPLVSASRAICMPSMALPKFFLVEANSSSFCAILLSISCLTWVSSSAALRTLFSSCSRAPSASESAASSSSFSASKRFLILSISWMERPPSLIWSMMSLISLESTLFSLRTSSNCNTDSSYAFLTRTNSEEMLRVSFWATSRSIPRPSTLCFHSPTMRSNCLAFFSIAALRI